MWQDTEAYFKDFNILANRVELEFSNELGHLVEKAKDQIDDVHENLVHGLNETIDHYNTLIPRFGLVERNKDGERVKDENGNDIPLEPVPHIEAHMKM